MCKSKCKEKARSFDSFGAPIGVTFNGDTSYKTTAGGIITIVLLIFLGGNLFLNVYDLYTNRQYTSHEANNFNSIGFNSNSWTMKTKN